MKSSVLPCLLLAVICTGLSLLQLSAAEPRATESEAAQGSPNAIGESLGRQGSLQYFYEPDGDFKSGGTFGYQDIRLSMPLYGRKFGQSWIGGLRTHFIGTEIYWANNPFLEERELLNKIDINFSLAYLPDDSPWRGFLNLSAALASDDRDIDSNDFQYTAILGVGYQFSDQFTLLAGGFVSQEFGAPRALGGPGFIWTPAPAWALSLIGPRLRVAYTLSEDWRLALEAFPDGARWSVKTQDGVDAFLDRGAVRIGFRLEYQVFRRSWINLTAGWVVGRDLTLEEQDTGRVLFESDVDTGPYASVGWIWTF